MGWFVSFCYFSLSPKLKLLMINMCQSSSSSSRNHLPEEPSSHTREDSAEDPWEAVLSKWPTEELPLFIPTKQFWLFEDDWTHCWAFQLSCFQVRTKGCLSSVSIQLWLPWSLRCDVVRHIPGSNSDFKARPFKRNRLLHNFEMDGFGKYISWKNWGFFSVKRPTFHWFTRAG